MAAIESRVQGNFNEPGKNLEARKKTTLSSSYTVPAITVELEPREILLQEITVTPDLFAIMGQELAMQQTLTQEDIQNITFGGDVYRALISHS